MPDFNRRSFLKSASLFAGFSVSPGLFTSIRAAAQIAPEPGSTYLDADHIVFLMQENRSFDHSFGTLQGVRGFNDPRAIDLPNGHPVWLQSDHDGRTFTPFHLDLKATCTSWTGALPHTWKDQTQARNHGKYDQWIAAKRPTGRFAEIPLTLGYHNRADLPFYYAFADAFTICDQHFCSSLTGTTPNRLHFWSGTIRSAQTPEAKANVYNSDCQHGAEQSWTTFPERLSAAGISWKVYQNEIDLDSGFSKAEELFLGNYGDNPLEYFSQYQAAFSTTHYQRALQLVEQLPAQIETLTITLNEDPKNARSAKSLGLLRKQLEDAQRDLDQFHPEKFASLPEDQRLLHQRAFTDNRADPNYRKLDTATYHIDGKTKTFTIPKGDLFHQFRADVDSGSLPTVSWLVAPENYSDHPSAPWNGAWYVSEALKILSKNPKLWKKTIFILNYDENDGYFDHIPPFVAPLRHRPETGACSASIDPSLEYVSLDAGRGIEGPIGLGYRVPLIVASSWTRGGWVNSQLFDLTSPIQFLEHFLNQKFKTQIRETNINSWRRAICGNLSSIFRPATVEAPEFPDFLSRDEWMSALDHARDQPCPIPGDPLTTQEIDSILKSPQLSPRLPRQEPGTRPSCALPYQLSVNACLNTNRDSIAIVFNASTAQFGQLSAGAPFQVYAPGSVAIPSRDSGDLVWESTHSWHYAVAAGESLTELWPLSHFPDAHYHLRVYGPNGFYREFKGSASDSAAPVRVSSQSSTPELMIVLDPGTSPLELHHLAYGYAPQVILPNPASPTQILLDLNRSSGWYDFVLTCPHCPNFRHRFAGRIETGSPSITDPLMGQAT